MSYPQTRNSFSPRHLTRSRRIRNRRLFFEGLDERRVLAVATWDGGSLVDSNWSTAANWVGDVTPSAGDNLIFPSGAARLTNTNDFAAGTSFTAMLLSGGGYTLGGNQVMLAGGLTAQATGNTVNLPLKLGAAVGVSNNSGGTLLLGGGIDLNGNTLSFADTSAASQTTVGGSISGAGNLSKANSGKLILASANSYTGTTTVSGGTLVIQNSGALGTADGTAATGTSVSGTLALEGGVTVLNERLSSPGNVTIQLASGANSWTGAIQVANALNVSGSGSGTFSGAINAYYLNGSWNGATRNVYSGPITITSQVDVSGSQFNGTITANYVYHLIDSVVNGTFTASYAVNGLNNSVVNGTITSASFLNGSNVSGTGTLSYTSGSLNIVNPGTASTPGILGIGSGDLGSYNVQLNGAAPGTGYDQLQATGSVNLSSGVLTVSLGITPTIGQTFTILANDGVDPITGSFSGLTEGALLVVGGEVLQLSYIGGDGNDVTLTKVAAAVWDGGSVANSNWSTAANWPGM